MIAYLALAALLPIAILTWRHSRLISSAVSITLLSTCAYAVLARAYPEAHAAGAFEAQRWASAIVGLAGAVEMGRGGRHVARARVAIRRAEQRMRLPSHKWRLVIPLPRAFWLGLLCLASMVGDGAAMLVWKALGEWVMPVAQIAVCLAICVIARWPERRSA